MRGYGPAYAGTRAPTVAQPAAAAARRPRSCGGAALAPRPPGARRRAAGALRGRGSAERAPARQRDRVLPHRAGGDQQRPAPRSRAQPLGPAFHRPRPPRDFGARRRRGLRSRGSARALGGRGQPGAARHGGAHRARRRLVRAALGARPGHDPARHLSGSGGGEGAGGRMTIRVLLADDHALVRAGIHSLLQAMREVQVIAEASSGEEALELVEREPPDVVLMDIAMKGITGLEAAAQMRERHPEVRVVILSMHSGEEYVLQALRAGAVGYLLKDAATGELELALRSVMRGESWLSPSVSRLIGLPGTRYPP